MNDRYLVSYELFFWTMNDRYLVSYELFLGL